MLLNCGVGEDSWESLGLQGDQTSQSQRKSVLNIHWKDWCWSWSSNTLATWCKKLTHWKRPWCWGRLKAGGEGDERIRWLDVITDSMGMSLSKLRELVMDREAWHAASQRVGHDWATELNWRHIIFKGDRETKFTEAFTGLNAVTIRAAGFATRSKRRLW